MRHQVLRIVRRVPANPMAERFLYLVLFEKSPGPHREASTAGIRYTRLLFTFQPFRFSNTCRHRYPQRRHSSANSRKHPVSGRLRTALPHSMKNPAGPFQ